jgi:phosphoglycerate dehydrogenase-like enzyme
MTTKIVVADRAIERFSDVLEKAPVEAQWTYCDPGDRTRLLEALSVAEVYIGSQFTPDMCEAASSIRLVHSSGAGVDRIHLAGLSREVCVANVFEHETSIAEHVLMVMLALSRELLVADSNLRRGIWTNATFDSSRTFNKTLSGRMLGLVGYGHIGRQLAGTARLLGMDVQAIKGRAPEMTDDTTLSFLGGPKNLDYLLRTSDFVVVVAPLTEQTRGLIDRRRLELMKPGAFLINVARGPIVDELALYSALRDGLIAGAGLDVWYEGPPSAGEVLQPATMPFWELPNVVMTPHCSGVTEDTFRKRAYVIGENVARYVRGQSLVNVIPK